MTCSRGIRGAASVNENTPESICETTIELISKMLQQNSVKNEDISHVIFTLTTDLDAAFPAKFARNELGWDFVPMMCFNELPVDGSIKKCLRALIVINTDIPQNKISHVYLGEAKRLRPEFGQ